MRWSQLSPAQREYLLAAARWGYKLDNTGKVKVRFPTNSHAEAIVALKALDRLDIERRNEAALESMEAAKAAYRGKVTALKAGNARGAGWMNIKRAGKSPCGLF